MKVKHPNTVINISDESKTSWTQIILPDNAIVGPDAPEFTPRICTEFTAIEDANSKVFCPNKDIMSLRGPSLPKNFVICIFVQKMQIYCNENAILL